ncbi:MAG: nitroreductase family protein [Oscillospiraceae bacterium]|nr:nitroreductase family protein [Oscillospiraceae bacterium]
MSYGEWIRARRSVRSFDGRALPQEEIDGLLAFARGVETPYGQRVEWRVLDAKAAGLTSPVITGTDAYIAGKLRRAPHAEEAFGYAFERVVLYAQSRGLGTTWIAGTMDRAAFERAMELEPGEVMPCVSPLGYPAAKMSVRESMMRKGVKADSRLPFASLFFEGGFDRPLGEGHALAPALELVRRAPSAVNRQPWRVVVTEGAAHFYEKRSKGYVSADGWDLQKVDLGIALCHFALGLEEQGRAARLRIDDPGLETPADVFYIASFDLT